MSEADIKSQCSEAQARKVIMLIGQGWEVERIEGSEVKLRKPGHSKWVKECGHDYP